MSDKSVAAVPVDLFNQITNYLMTRPYNEVAKLVDELRQGVQLMEVNVETPESPAEEENSDAEGF